MKTKTIGKCGVCGKPWDGCVCVVTMEKPNTPYLECCECCGGLPDIFGKCLAGCDDE